MQISNSFVLKSDDCPEAVGVAPPRRIGKKSLAEIQLELLQGRPYHYTLEDLNYAVYQQQKHQSGEVVEPRGLYLSKGRPCMRASPLIKRYGWGAHYDADGRIAIYPAGSSQYEALSSEQGRLTVVKGVRSKRPK